mgnify:FL=1|tara:strand:- start:87988 stop:88119 length:132 start_codon:yes stop_codon:yes gene_type:complete
MKLFLILIKILFLVLSMPFEISKGSKRRVQKKIKKLMIIANLL